jgi:hypothetical protein
MLASRHFSAGRVNCCLSPACPTTSGFQSLSAPSCSRAFPRRSHPRTAEPDRATLSTRAAPPLPIHPTMNERLGMGCLYRRSTFRVPVLHGKQLGLGAGNGMRRGKHCLFAFLCFAAVSTASLLFGSSSIA